MSSRRVAVRTTDQQSDPKDSFVARLPRSRFATTNHCSRSGECPPMRGDRALATFAGSHGVAGRARGEE